MAIGQKRWKDTTYVCALDCLHGVLQYRWRRTSSSVLWLKDSASINDDNWSSYSMLSWLMILFAHIFIVPRIRHVQNSSFRFLPHKLMIVIIYTRLFVVVDLLIIIAIPFVHVISLLSFSSSMISFSFLFSHSYWRLFTDSHILRLPIVVIAGFLASSFLKPPYFSLLRILLFISFADADLYIPRFTILGCGMRGSDTLYTGLLSSNTFANHTQLQIIK